jgi:heme-degrading monooxygenase HmoA
MTRRGGPESEIWIRIVTYGRDLSHPESSADYMAYTAKNVVRVLQGCQGYRNGYWAEDPDTGRMAAITYWESREAIEAADPKLDRFHHERERLGVTVESVENFRLLPVTTGLGSWIEDAYVVRDRLRQEGVPPFDDWLRRGTGS